MQDSELLLIGTFSVCLFMGFLWQIQKMKGEADIVDFGWTVSLGFLAVLYSFFGSAESLGRSFVGLFSAIWAFRLGMHLWKRVSEPGEDGRYSALRQSWGKNAQRNFFIFFQAQALLAVLMSVSFLVPTTENAQNDDIALLLALTWFVISISGETIADLQLNAWRKNPANKGRTCRAGLWNYSRHPNYFFEWLYWFTYVILSFGSPHWELTLLTPTIILFLILKVTGIPPTEARALKTKGNDYVQYQRTTSAFVPWFKRNLK